jgi:beta-glucosidase
LIRLHHVAATLEDAAKQALEAGVDCEVPEGLCFSTLVGQVRAGEVALETVDRATAHILRAKIRLGLLDDQPQVDPDAAERVTNCAAHQELALQAAREAVVLLKNADALLPLDLDALTSIAVIGPNAADLHLGGYAMDPQRGTSVLDGIRAYADEDAQVRYAEGCRITEGDQGYIAWHQDAVQRSDPAEDDARIAEAVALAADSDVAVLVLGGNESTCREGWWFNHLGDRADLHLLGRQEDLVEAVVATGTPTVVVLINGRPLNLTAVADTVPALLEGWYLGQATGTAVAEILFGAVNPSGKLPVSFPRTVGQLPVYYYHRPSAKRGYLFTPTDPLFPFGFGLSYTTFTYSDVHVTPEALTPEGAVTVTIDVTNTGTRAGTEVVQLYIHDPVSSVTRPVQLLKDFQRVRLAPGETQTVTFTLPVEKLAFLDRAMQWRVEPGAYEVRVGGSSADTHAASFEITG